MDFFPLEPITSYCEPFAGGAGLFWMLRTDIKRHLNDIDPILMALYKEARDNPKFSSRISQVVKRVKRADDLYREFYEARVRYKFDHCPYAFWLVNRGSFGCFCSIQRSNGATLSWHMLNNALKSFTPQRLRFIVETLQDVTLTTGDYKRAIESCSADTFLFIDAPYKSSAQNYGYEMTDEQHEDLADFLSREKRQWMMTMGKSETALSLYVGRSWCRCRVRQYSNSYNPQKTNRIGQELIITNYD